jgi:hypothetical protein
VGNFRDQKWGSNRDRFHFDQMLDRSTLMQRLSNTLPDGDVASSSTVSGSDGGFLKVTAPTLASALALRGAPDRCLRDPVGRAPAVDAC